MCHAGEAGLVCLFEERRHLWVGGRGRADQQKDGYRSRRNFGAENAPVPDHLAWIRLDRAHIVRALPGRNRPRASQASIPDRANQTGLATESLIDGLHRYMGGLRDGRDRGPGIPSAQE